MMGRGKESGVLHYQSRDRILSNEPSNLSSTYRVMWQQRWEASDVTEWSLRWMVNALRSGILAICPDIVALLGNTVSKRFSNSVSLLFRNSTDIVAKQWFVDMHARGSGNHWSNITKWAPAPALCAAYVACGHRREKWSQNLDAAGWDNF
jgi:hypothetical protein